MNELKNIAFKCTWNDSDFKGICSDSTYKYNTGKKRAWCTKAKCRDFTGVATAGKSPCYESIIFSEWRYGAGWDHKNLERPRKINNSGLNKIVFLTTLEPDKKEDDRRIIGLFKITNILGGELHETIVVGNPENGIALPKNINLKFWDFYKNPKAPHRKVWGTGLFRYIDNNVTLNILKELKSIYSMNDNYKKDIIIIESFIADLPVSTSKKELTIQGKTWTEKQYVCLKCGNEIRRGSKFCTKCGVKIVICFRCNSLNFSDDGYCSDCGHKLNNLRIHQDTTHDSSKKIRDKLIEYGVKNKKSLSEIIFTQNEEANELVKNDPIAFLFGVIFDQGVVAESAWGKPFELKTRFKHLNVRKIATLKDDDINTVFSEPSKIHRFWKTMGRRIIDASKKITDKYNGKAENIWNDNPTSEEMERRFREFDGIGQKKASMAVNILVRDFGVHVQNLSGIDVSYDVMVRRVFLRAGLSKKDSQEGIIKAARELNPEYPGALDYPTWLIGRTYCLTTYPLCSQCPLMEDCPKNII